MIYPGLSPFARAIHGGPVSHWDDAYVAPGGARPSLLLDFEAQLYGISGGKVAMPLSGARIGRAAVDGLAPGLLVEPARTNLATQSVATSTGWTGVGTPVLTELGETALGLFPGLSIASGGANWHRAQAPAVSFPAATDHYLTLWYRAGSAGYAKIILYNSGTSPATNLEVAGVPGALAATVQGNGAIFDTANTDLGGGIWRVRFGFRVNDPITSAWGVGPGSVTAGEDVVAYAMQIEAGGAATGYIATAGSSAGRAADALNLSAAPWAGSAAGSLVISARAETAQDCPFVEFEDAAGATLALMREASGAITARHAGLGGPASLSAPAGVARSVPVKVGLAWDAGGLSLAVDGAAAINGTAPEMLTPGSLRFFASGLGEGHGPGLIGLVRHFRSRLPDAELAAITA